MSDLIGVLLGGLIVILPVFLFIWVQIRERRETESKG
jgi:F0F1-type ATP synthase assembly protein I